MSVHRGLNVIVAACCTDLAALQLRFAVCETLCTVYYGFHTCRTYDGIVYRNFFENRSNICPVFITLSRVLFRIKFLLEISLIYRPNVPGY